MFSSIFQSLKCTEIAEITKMPRERICEVAGCYPSGLILKIIGIYRSPHNQIADFLDILDSARKD